MISRSGDQMVPFDVFGTLHRQGCCGGNSCGSGSKALLTEETRLFSSIFEVLPCLNVVIFNGYVKLSEGKFIPTKLRTLV